MTMATIKKVTFPTLSNIVDGIKASFALISLQWGLNRSIKSKVIFSIVITVLSLSMFFVSKIGWFIKFLAIENPESAASQFAKTYIASFARGEMGTIGATALGFCILSSLLSPFTGATSTSFIPPKEMAGLSVVKWQRFVDSIIAQVISSISLLQLVILTALTTMITMDSANKTGAYVLTWVIWVFLVTLTNLSLWISEYVSRRFTSKIKGVITSTVLIILGIAVILDPNHGSTVFSIGNIYSEQVSKMSKLDTLDQLITIGLVSLASMFLVYVSAVMSSLSLALPEPYSNAAKNKKPAGSFIKGSGLTSIFLRSMLRVGDIKRPILSSLILGAVIITLAPQTYSVNTTFAIVIPLVIALAWGANALAVLGGGAVWMQTQPKALKNAPWVIFLTQVIMAMALFIVIWIPAGVTGRSSLDNLLSNFLAVLAVSVITARSATSKSINAPEPMQFGSRGESSLSPSKALEYTLRFALWGGVYGIAILSIEDLKTQLYMAGAAVGWSVLRVVLMQDKWDSSIKQAQVIAKVSND